MSSAITPVKSSPGPSDISALMEPSPAPTPPPVSLPDAPSPAGRSPLAAPPANRPPPRSPPPAGGPSPTPSVKDPPRRPTVPPRNAPYPPAGGGSKNGSSGLPPGSRGKSGLLPPPSPREDSSGISRQWLVGGIAAGGVVAVAFLALLYFCSIKRRKKGRRPQSPQSVFSMPPRPPPWPTDKWQQSLQPAVTNLAKPSPPTLLPSSDQPHHRRSSSASSASNLPGMELVFGRSTFTYEELAMATDGFSDGNLLGQGGFGYVHKGVLPNGKMVAVKHLKAQSLQGEREFQAEVEIISTVHHKHLVSLVGYCISGSHRMLVYEFIPNRTLECHLHGKGSPVMDWPTRLHIAIGSAKGLAYLHEDCHPKIIHRDIKASNILLDFDFEPKVADFGLAKFTPDEYTHVSTRIMGTIGYLAPEYASSGKLTEKSDIFSFGVMLLELITGRRPFDTKQSCMDECLVDWARPLLTRALEDGDLDIISDPRLENGFNHYEMVRMVACASACLRHFSRHRPSMGLVVRALQGNLSLSQLNGSDDYDSALYNENMSKLWRRALDSQQYTTTADQYNSQTGQCSNHSTSEYGLYPSDSGSEFDRTRELDARRIWKESPGFRAAA